MTAPSAPVPPAAGVETNTPWIWLHLVVPLVTFVPMAFIDWPALVRVDPARPSAILQAQLAVFLSPAYLLTIGISWVAYGLAVLFAWLDHRELSRRGIPRPFHWGFAFFSNYVYVIGRTVVALRRTGRGWPPLAVAIAIFALSIIGSIVLSVWLVTLVFDQIPAGVYPA